MGDNACAKETRLYGFVSWLMEKYYQTLKALRKRLKKLYDKSLKINLTRIILENLKSNGIYLYLAWLTFQKKISIGGFSQYFNAASQFSESISDFANFLVNLDINGKYIASFKDFMSLQPEIQKEYSSLYKENFEKAIKKPLDISMSHVNFRYKGMDKPAIEDFSYTFEQGKVYVIAGENGAGKSTLINLISNLYKPWKKVKSLDKGIAANLGKIFYKDGVVLSGGENQKLAFARAIFHNPKILVLDEPSSALDPVAEDELLKSFQQISKDKIVIYISHRLSSAVLADEILYIKNGKLCESGTHQQLLKQHGEYARYYNTQAKYYN